MEPSSSNNNNFWELKNSTTSKHEVDMYIYGYIETYRWNESDVTAYSFAKELNSFTDVKTINVRINSYGGSVCQALAIRNTLINHSAEVIVYIEGIAASAATIISTAGDKVYMCPGTTYMIHNPRTGYISGEVKDLKKRIYMLESTKTSIVNLYKEKTGLEENKIIQLMDDETWFTAEEAVSYNFADEIKGEGVTATIDNNIVNINGVKFRDESIVAKISSNIKFKDNVLKPSENINENSEGFFIQNYKEEKKVDTPKQIIINSAEELRNQHPSLVKEIINAATKIERERIRSIEDIENSIPDKELVKKAKFTDVMEAKDLAFLSLQSDTQKAVNYLNNMEQDSLNSNVSNIESVGNEGNTSNKGDNDDSIIAMVAKTINERGEDNATQ